MDAKRLQEILSDHRLWLADDGGERADLGGADLGGANLIGANLIGANLSGANLGEAILSRANLIWADLSEANLIGANLRGADLGGANLSEAKLNWNSRALVSEVLWQAATSIKQEMFAALVARKPSWDWQQFLEETPENLREWALGVLREYVQDGDDAPDCLKS